MQNSQADYLVIRHIAREPLGLLGSALERAGRTFRYVDSANGDPVPGALDGERGLIVLGGPMGVYEAAAHPYLEDEIRLIARVVEQGRPILGICLGAQLLAAALGARVYKGEQGPELGWGEVARAAAGQDDRVFATAPERLRVLQWHGDTFDLPAGAERLWSNPQYVNQAFHHGHAYGLQFHLELTPQILEDWLDATSDEEFRRAGTTRAAIESETGACAARLTPVAHQIFDRWIGLDGGPPRCS
jgi:GMP synthase (glutamine-hydrolysing)